MAAWFLSPSGWPTHADTDDETWDLEDRGYTSIAEADVPAAVAAYQAAQSQPPVTPPPGYALAADVAASLATKANASSLPGKLSISDIGNPESTGGAALRAAFDAVIGATQTDQAAAAASLGVHLWADITADVYQRDGDAVAASSVILAHDTPAGRPYLDLNPDTVNDIAAVTGGSEGVIGAGGALPTGWTLVNPSGASVSVERAAAGPFDVELLVTIPAGSEVGYTSPDITEANDTRHITFNLTLAATDLQFVTTRVGWAVGAGASEFAGGGGGQVAVEIAGSSQATDKIGWVFKNTHPTMPVTVRALVKTVSVYKPEIPGGLRRTVQPVATGTINARDVTVGLAAGDYVLFAWAEGRGLVGERVTVAGSSVSLRSVVGNGRVTKIAAWKADDYTDGMVDVLDPPAWEQVDEFGTAHLESMADTITSVARMRYQAPGNPWNVRVAVNRFSRSRAEVRPGEYLIVDTTGEVAYPRAYQRRAEVLANRAYPYDTDLWTSFAFRTDSVLAEPDAYGLIWQWLDTGVEGDLIRLSPSCSLQLRQSGQLGLYTASTAEANPATQPPVELRWLGRFNVGAWNRVVLRTNFSKTGGGQLGLWLNGDPVYPWQATPMGANKPGVQPHYGFYGGQSRATVVVEHANVEFGTRDLAARIATPLPV